jgi:hypothetical protein
MRVGLVLNERISPDVLVLRLAAFWRRRRAFLGLMMKRLFLFLAMLLFPAIALGQTTAVTAQITDSDSIQWANGTFRVTFVPNPQFSGPYQYQGSQFSPQVFTGAMDSSGAMSVTVPDNNFISPAGTQWLFTLCPNASAPCTPVTLPVAGASVNLTSTFSAAAIAPRFPAKSQGLSWGYSTVEINQTPVPGGAFFNVTLLCTETWNGTAFVCSTSGTVTNFSAGNLSPLFTTTVTNPNTTPMLNFIPDSVTANVVLAGPTSGTIDSGSNVNSGNGTVVSVTGTPTAAPEAVLFIGNYSFSSGSGTFPTPTVPASGWTVIDTPATAGVFLNTAATTSPFTASSTLGFTSDWTASLLLLGTSGSVSLSQSPINLCSGSVGNATCNHAFTNPIGAGHSIIAFITSGQAAGTSTCSATDTLLNQYSLVVNEPSPSTRQLVLIAIGSPGGSDTLTVTCTSSLGMFAGAIVGYELSGITAVSGAYSFRHLVGADLPFPTTSSLGGVKSYVSPAHQFVTSINADGSVSSAQPSASDISGGVVTAVNGTANQINSSGGSTPILSLSSSLIAPGTVSIPSLTPTRCVQTGASGLLTVASGPCSVGSGVLAQTTCNLGAPISSIGSGVTQSVIACAATAPSSGCPCRAYVSWNIAASGTSSTEQVEGAISDGTNTFAGTSAILNNQVTTGFPGINRSDMSPVTYTNSQALTFTLSAVSDHTWTIETATSFLSLPTQVRVTYLASN